MFEKKPKSYTDLLGKTNRIVEGTIIQGDITSSADFRLDGHLIGNFQSKGKIVIGPAGSVKGNIICKNCDIEGKFEGKILVLEILNLKAVAIRNGLNYTSFQQRMAGRKFGNYQVKIKLSDLDVIEKELNEALQYVEKMKATLK